MKEINFIALYIHEENQAFLNEVASFQIFGYCGKKSNYYTRVCTFFAVFLISHFAYLKTHGRLLIVAIWPHIWLAQVSKELIAVSYFSLSILLCY